MLSILCTALTLLFSGAVADLGSPRWATREAATRSLARYWPLTEPAIRRAERSADPEVSERARHVRRAVAHKPRTRGLALLTQPFTAGELAALALIADPHEFDGLPWAREEAWYGSADAGPLADIESVRRKLRLLPGVDDPWYGPETGGPFDESGGIFGLSGVRFAFRGLPGPCYYWSADEMAEARRKWADVKAGR